MILPIPQLPLPQPLLNLRAPVGLNFSTLCCKWSQFLLEENSSLVYDLLSLKAKSLSYGYGAGRGDNGKLLCQWHSQFRSWVLSGGGEGMIPSDLFVWLLQHRITALQTRRMMTGSQYSHQHHTQGTAFLGAGQKRLAHNLASVTDRWG